MLVVLNVNFYEDGTGVISEGSTYPNTIVDEDNCVTNDSALPITDEFIYVVDFTAENHLIPSSNILGYVPNESDFIMAENGIPMGYDNPLPFQGQAAGRISLAQSDYFDNFPLDPFYPTICDGVGNCFDVILPDTVIAGGQELPGTAGGYVLQVIKVFLQLHQWKTAQHREGLDILIYT